MRADGHPVRLLGGRLVLDFVNTADWTTAGKVVHEKLASDSKLREAEIAAYKANMKSPTPDPNFVERWYDTVETPDGNVAKTIVGWWLRRYMDGTEDEWTPVLRKTLELYDGAWLKGRSR